VLTVVYHQQQLLVAQVVEKNSQRLGRGLVSQVERGQDGVAHQGRILDFSQLDQPRAVTEAAAQVRRDPDRKAGFADAARPDQADHAG
jgi:hypothetical protein